MNKKILIIDDSHEIQILLTTLLESKGYTVKCSANGQEALDWLEAEDNTAGLILLDIEMPIMNGLTFLNEYEKKLSQKNIPIVLMSGQESIKLENKVTSLIEILKKPVSTKTLIDKIEKYYLP